MFKVSAARVDASRSMQMLGKAGDQLKNTTLWKLKYL